MPQDFQKSTNHEIFDYIPATPRYSKTIDYQGDPERGQTTGDQAFCWQSSQPCETRSWPKTAAQTAPACILLPTGQPSWPWLCGTVFIKLIRAGDARAREEKSLIDHLLNEHPKVLHGSVHCFQVFYNWSPIQKLDRRAGYFELLALVLHATQLESWCVVLMSTLEF